MDRASPEILVIEDDQWTREKIEGLLQQNGFQVTCVANAKGAWEALANRAFDLILLDVMLPDEDGRSFCQRLRTESSLPIIMMSGVRAEASHRTEGLKMGADDYVVKPFDENELVERVRTVRRRTASSRRWSLDEGSGSLRAPNGCLVELSFGLYKLVCALADAYPSVLSFYDLLECTLGTTEHEVLLNDEASNVITMDNRVRRKIRRIREALEKAYPGGSRLIRNRYGQGYGLNFPIDRK